MSRLRRKERVRAFESLCIVTRVVVPQNSWGRKKGNRVRFLGKTGQINEW